ncbi:hypothetical protein D9615_007575 [Tricholomella constricta]|uniref:BTB domain-containing protein n=1 Tax=Tricholomella constricta TaxID=117010 RepID=A0A8H5H7K9_9AGAR|nr:hypothetical protein D9615_007575 [Tricholomella constricta]
MPVSYVGAIRSVLETYPPSKGLFRELLQNSEDAKAQKQIFVLDHRRHAADAAGLATSATRGPALLAYNDSVFTERDFESLSTIWDSSKKLDNSKIGKYGMGFRSTFHITDTPQVLSESTLVILDPLKILGADKEDIRLDLTGQDASRRAELTAPFALDVFQPDVATSLFRGSVVRLPLRTLPSEISSKVYAPAEIRQLFLDFAQEEIHIALLFLNSVSCIEMYEIDAEGRRTCLARSDVGRGERRALSEAGMMPGVDVAVFDVEEKGTRAATAAAASSERWRILHAAFPFEHAAAALKKRMGAGPEVDAAAALAKHKLHPKLAIAVPMSVVTSQGQDEWAFGGRLFTYLPLPLMTHFCVHVHALFALTPSREKLQNREEKPARGSDYHISVEWNKLLFEEYLPQAWMHLLLMLKNEGISDIFAAWPPPQSLGQLGDSGYWELLPAKLLACIVQSKSRVWPVAGLEIGGRSDYLELESVLVAAIGESQELLRALAAFGLRITRPPEFVAQLLREGAGAKMLSPATAYEYLLEHPREISSDSVVDKIPVLLRYLLSSGSVTNVIGLPLIPLSNNRRVSLTRRDGSSTIYTMLETEEFVIFGARDENAIALDRLEQSISACLKRQGPYTLNVQILTPDIVVKYLGSYPKAPGLVPGTKKVDDSIVSWLSAFWDWVRSSSFRHQLYPMIKHLPLLPTQGGLKSTDFPVFRKQGMHPSHMSILEELRVAFINEKFSWSALSHFRHFSDANNLYEILNALTMENIQAFKADEVVITELIAYISARPSGALNDDQRAKLRRLPIYPLAVAPLSSVRRRTHIPDGQRVIGAFVQDLCVLPSVRDVIFLDASQLRPSIIQMLDPNTQDRLTDIELLRMGLDQFAVQPVEKQRAFVEFMARWRSKVPWELIEKLKNTPFVATTRGQKRCPGDLIDPESPLENLFAKDSDCFPWVQGVAERKLVGDLRSLGLMQSALSTNIVKERIGFIVAHRDQRYARRLLGVIYQTGFKLTSMPEITSQWLPTPKGLLSPGECRDDPYHKELFDHVLSSLDHDVNTDRSLRELLGWNQPISLNVLVKQLSCMMALPEEQSYSRVYLIIKELIQRSLSEENVAALRNAVSDRAWVPVPGIRSRLVPTEHAVFEGEDPSVGFFQVPFAGSRERTFFMRMGCSEIPSTTAILKQLSILQATEAPSTKVAEKALRFLRLLPKNLTEEERHQILVPDVKFTLRPLPSVFYNDLAERACLVALSDGDHLAYSRIDEDLAKFLGMERLGLKFVDLKPSLGVDMGEELTTTIRNKLRSYTPRQILTEFLANAADAGATKFGILLDETQAPTQGILAREMGTFQTLSSLVIHNNAVFTDADFDGICQTGIGGKAGRTDSIGQFGFGALTMFHLTDLAMIVSGEHVLFLNPSKNALPIRDRASLRLPLRGVKQMYPGHLSALDGIFGFELGSSEPYNGTLFRLPLRSASHPARASSVLGDVWPIQRVATEIVQPFEVSAEEFMLFTGIHTIAINRRDYRGLRASRTITSRYRAEHTIGTNMSKIIDVSLEGGAGSQSTWHVVSTSLPKQEILSPHLVIKYRMRMPIMIALAARIGATHKNEPQHKLFSTVPLATSTSLPVHLTAPFILSDDRRQIRLDDLDPAVSTYNRWLLSDAIPPLYMFLLADLLQHHHSNLPWWPGDTDKEDDITARMTTSFYSKYMGDTEQRVILPAYGSPGHYLPPRDAVVLVSSSKAKALDNVFQLVKPPLASLRKRVARRAIEDAKIARLSPSYLKDIILRSPINPAPQSEFEDLHKLMLFLCEESLDDLLGLHLLPLADGSFGTFENTKDIARTYFVAHGSVHDLFLKNPRLVHRNFSTTESILDSTTRLLSIAGLNVTRLAGPGVALLLAERLKEVNTEGTLDTETQRWISAFWKEFSKFGASIEDVGAFPLVPTTNPGRYTSIDKCKSRLAVVFSNEVEEPRIWESLSSLGLTIVARHTSSFPHHLRDLLSGQDFTGFSFQDTLMAMMSIQTPSIVERFDRLSPELRTLFSTWCRRMIMSNALEGPLIASARKLPIWPAVSSQLSSQLYSANEIVMLPLGLSKDTAGRFICITASTYSTGLIKLGVQPQTFAELLATLHLPRVLPSRDVEAYRTLLEILSSSSHSSWDSLRLPDCSRVLTQPKELYVRSPLFSAAFEGSPHRFVHEAFRDLEARGELDKFGLRREGNLDHEMFKACASAISNSDSADTNALIRRATVVFESFCESLPLRITADWQWREYSSLRFIPRNSSRWQAVAPAEIDLSTYARHLPMIVSPNEILLPIYAPIAWTQRGLINQPNRRILTAYEDFGKPSFSDVVEHLKILALRVLKDHPTNRRIVRDLKATYEWLNANCESPENSRLLLQNHGLPFFLNVADLDAQWEWHSAEQLLLNESKVVDRFHPVQRFLLPFEKLLRASGVQEVFHPTAPPDSDSATDSAQLASIRKTFLELRQARKLTDVIFDAGDDIEEILPGHRTFLATYSTFFYDAFTNDIESANLLASVSNPKVVNVEDFGSRSVRFALDFAYTGTIPVVSDEDLDLCLEILRLSDYWLMDRLHDEIQRLIIRKSGVKWEQADQAPEWPQLPLGQLASREAPAESILSQSHSADSPAHIINAADAPPVSSEEVDEDSSNFIEEHMRKKTLEDDIWASEVQPHSVLCNGCKETIHLHDHYLYHNMFWEKHRDKCQSIRALLERQRVKKSKKPKHRREHRQWNSHAHKQDMAPLESNDYNDAQIEDRWEIEGQVSTSGAPPIGQQGYAEIGPSNYDPARTESMRAVQAIMMGYQEPPHERYGQKARSRPPEPPTPLHVGLQDFNSINPDDAYWSAQPFAAHIYGKV